VTLIQHSHDFLTEPHGGADFMVRYRCFYRFGGVVMTTAGLKSSQRTKAMRVSFASRDVRTLIANQPGVDVKTCDG
jgi:hypothetical protein